MNSLFYNRTFKRKIIIYFIFTLLRSIINFYAPYSIIIKKIYNARLNTGIAERVPNTSNIGFEYIEGELILLHLSDLGICASSGSACTSGSLEPSHVLRAMNVPFTAIHGSIRWSLSRFTTEAEIDYVIDKLPGIIEKVTSISPYQKELQALKALKNA